MSRKWHSFSQNGMQATSRTVSWMCAMPLISMPMATLLRAPRRMMQVTRRSLTDLASGSDGAEHRTVRLLHPRESGAEARCIAGQELNRRAALALQRGRDPSRQGRGGALADDLDAALAQVTAAQLDLRD